MKKILITLFICSFFILFIGISSVYATSCTDDYDCLSPSCACCSGGTCGTGTSCTRWCSSGEYCGSSGCTALPPTTPACGGCGGVPYLTTRCLDSNTVQICQCNGTWGMDTDCASGHPCQGTNCLQDNVANCSSSSTCTTAGCTSDSVAGICGFSSTYDCSTNTTYKWQACNPVRCADGYTTTPNGSPAIIFTCSCCSNGSLTCYKIPTCVESGGTKCYPVNSDGSSCSDLTSSFPQFIYTSKSGYCSSGYCCLRTDCVKSCTIVEGGLTIPTCSSTEKLKTTAKTGCGGYNCYICEAKTPCPDPGGYCVEHSITCVNGIGTTYPANFSCTDLNACNKCGTDLKTCVADATKDKYTVTGWANNGSCGTFQLCYQRQTRTCTPVCNGVCPAVSQDISCGAVNGFVGVCNNSGAFLCSPGTAISQSTVGNVSTWVCQGTDGTCTGTDGANSGSCSYTGVITYTYSWNTGAFGACSSCTQSRAVTCRRNDGVTVADGNCSGVKPATNQACGAAPGSAGACDNSGAFLCSPGTAISQSTVGNVSTWVCQGTDGTCTGSAGANSGTCSYTGVVVCTPDPSCAANTCTGSTCTSCGINYPGTKTANCGAEAANTCSGVNYPSPNGCGTCAGTKAVVAGIDGVCGTSNGKTFAAPGPTTNLCADNSTPAVTLLGLTYSWTCSGTVGTCGGTNGTNASCSATQNRAPTVSSLTIKNNLGNVVSAESGNKNQICQPGSDDGFNGSRRVTFEVSASDPDGDALTYTLYWWDDKKNIPMVGNVGTTDLPDDWNNNSAQQIVVTVSDGKGGSATVRPRDLKIWDCKVAVSGYMYDASEEEFGPVCSSGMGFTKLVTDAANFKTITYKDVAENKTTIDVIAPAYNYYNSTTGQELIWGTSYTPLFNDGLAEGLASDGSIGIRIINKPCPFELSLNTGVVDPYGSDYSLEVDFSTTVNQGRWWQVVGGGVKAGYIIDNIPPTCVESKNCVAAISIANDKCGSSLNLAQTVNSESRNGSINKMVIADGQATSVTKSGNKSIESTGVYRTTGNIVEEDHVYSAFKSRFHDKARIGSVTNETSFEKILADVGGTGVVFVEGTLNIDVGNTVKVGDFLMVTAGSISIGNTAVTKIEGVFVSNSGIGVSGSSDTPLTINGMLYAGGNVVLNRDYLTKSMNNSAPSVRVVYRPDFLFNMPGKMTKVMSGWSAN